MSAPAYAVLLVALLLPAYAYVGYPLALWVLGARRPRPAAPSAADADLPRVSITIPAYNEEREIGAALEAILALDYPAHLRQVLVVSDASSDGTDEVVRSFAARGVELLRLPERRGKTGAEGAAAARLTGDVVVNTDASIRIPPGSLRPLVAAFADPTVGLASGRDVSVSRAGAEAGAGEGGYVGFEMAVRRLETRVGGIVGASGCFYAVRAHLHRTPLPEGLSRDFAAALLTRRAGLRAVSVDRAVCLVPRTASLSREYRRKVRTMSRGMETLAHLRALLNPLRYGSFAWMLLSHKVCRWLVPWTALAALAVLVAAAPGAGWARALLGAAAAGALLAAAGASWPEGRPVPRLLSLAAYAVAGNVAVLHATLRACRGGRGATWEPTRREAAVPR